MRKILICFGGVSPEHEVSIITGLQVLEHIDRSQYMPSVLYVSQKGEFFYMNIDNRDKFLSASKKKVVFGRDEKGGFMQPEGLLSNKIYIDVAYLAFHGGNGESGALQGMFEALGIPYTSPSIETSSISMNKALTKEVLEANGINIIPGVSVRSKDIISDLEKVTKQTISKIKLPLIVKPAHLGSSIGVTVVKTETSLTKALMASSLIDSEIVIEKCMQNFVEYNCSVRLINGQIEVSEVERPIMKDEILSFSDKYQNGGKKIGGMASLSRELPAKIDEKLKKDIQEKAKSIYMAIRAKGVIRCDFMYVAKKLYLIEVNPIPGSMSFYLWEATGVSFDDQITNLIEESLIDAFEKGNMVLDYHTDIVEKFINSKDQ